MGKRISAKIAAPGHEPYRAYFEESGDMILVWAKNAPWVGFKTGRFNSGVFSRDWVRALFADGSVETKVEF